MELPALGDALRNDQGTGIASDRRGKHEAPVGRQVAR